MCETCKRLGFDWTQLASALFREPLMGEPAVRTGSLSEVLSRAVDEARDSDEEAVLKGLQRRVEVLEKWASRKVQSDLKGALKRFEDEEKAKDTDSVLASHSERTDALVDRVSALEAQAETERKLRLNADTEIGVLKQQLTAQGRQLEELLLWRESVENPPEHSWGEDANAFSDDQNQVEPPEATRPSVDELEASWIKKEGGK